MATDKTVWFGTEGRMAWIKAPATGMGRTRAGWSAPAQLLNGGALQLSSAYSHLMYDLSWSTLDTPQRSVIKAYAAGLYGSGPLYFVDPSAVNILPLSWSAPMLTGMDAPSLIRDRRPSLSNISGTTMPGLPLQYATYAMGGTYSARVLKVAVPRDMAVAFYGFGTATGTAVPQVKVRTTPGGVQNALPVPLYPVSTMTVQSGVTAVTNFNGANDIVTLELTGSGSLTLAGLQAVLYDPKDIFQPQTQYHIGEGNSGLRFVTPPAEQVYSSRLDLTGMTAQLIETGEWENA